MKGRATPTGAELRLESVRRYHEIVVPAKIVRACSAAHTDHTPSTYRGAGWVERALRWTAEIVRHPPKPAPEEVMMRWAREWAKEGVKLDTKRFMPERGPRPFLPKRWIVERTFSWLGQNRRMSKDYERLPESSEASTYVAMSRLMARRLTRS